MDQSTVLNLAKAYADAVRSIMKTSGAVHCRTEARGTAARDSDIDIAVVVDRLPDDYLETLSLLWKLTRSVSQEIEPVLLSGEDDESGFLRTVQTTGIAV